MGERPLVWVAVLLVVGVGIGVLGTVLIVGTGGGSSHVVAALPTTLAPTTTTTTTVPLSGAAQELVDLLARGNTRSFHARYAVVSPTAQGQGATVSLEVWRQPPLVRQDTLVSAGGKTTDTAAFALQSGLVECTKSDPAPWTCQSASAAGTGLADLSTLTQRITAQLATASVTAKDDTVSGRPARCFTVTLDANSTQVCVDADGVPLLEASGGSQLQLQALDTEIPGGVFAVPAKVGGA